MRCLLFDLDETLYDEELYRRSGLRAVCDWLEQRCMASASQAEEAGLELVRARGWLYGGLFQDLLLALRLDLGRIPELLQVYRSHNPTIHMYADVEILLPQLRGMTLGVITEGLSEVQWAKIRALGLTRWIPEGNVIVTGDLTGSPDKLTTFPFAEAENRFSCRGEDILYVGDNPVRDFLQPRMRGWQTARIRRGRFASWPDSDEAHWVIDAFCELPTLPPFTKRGASLAK